MHIGTPPLSGRLGGAFSVDSYVPQGTLCAFGFCAIRVFCVKNEYQYFGAEILNTESTDVYCQKITQSI